MPSLCAHVHRCSCVHCYIVFLIMFYACISILQNSWDRWICFLFPPQAAFFPTVSQTSLSFRCFKSSVTDMLLPHLSQVYSPLTTGGCATLSALHHYSFFLPLSFPHSSLTPPQSAVLRFPHLQHIHVFVFQHYFSRSP